MHWQNSLCSWELLAKFDGESGKNGHEVAMLVGDWCDGIIGQCWLLCNGVMELVSAMAARQCDGCSSGAMVARQVLWRLFGMNQVTVGE